jgi:hypothetical protein
MPKYTLPPLPRKTRDNHDPMYDGDEIPDEWTRRIRIPVSDEIVKALSVGGAVTCTLKGTAYELTSSAGGRTELALQVEEVEAYGEQSAEDDFLAGFESKRGNVSRLNDY